jgi:hypothetical protein
VAGDGEEVNYTDVGGIDFRYLDGFTARELLTEAACVASGEEDSATVETAFKMLASLRASGRPSLTAAQVEQYVGIVKLAADYESGAHTDKPDEFATEEERRTYAMLKNADLLTETVRALGSK